ncbi:MAG: hypothetical protein ABUS56_06495 [Acidobacteriota bacterium]
MTIIDQALWLLCSLGATVFAAAASARWLAWLLIALGFVAASTLSAAVPDASVAGSVAALVATALLARADAGRLLGGLVMPAAAVCAGVLAAWSGALLHANGVPRAGALAVGAAWPTLSACLVATRRDFAPQAIREEALLLVSGAGLGVAMVPHLVEGWRSAVALNVQPLADGAVLAVPAWTLLVVTGALGVGGMSALFSRWRSR